MGRGMFCGILYKLFTDKLYAFKREKCYRGKLSEERITELVDANSDESEELPLLMVGKLVRLTSIFQKSPENCESRKYSTCCIRDGDDLIADHAATAASAHSDGNVENESTEVAVPTRNKVHVAINLLRNYINVAPSSFALVPRNARGDPDIKCEY
ncbi:hypothetical protein FQA39_LY07441 [Lamprigera yunnana]|nr:hypothetical protein FQA39_LY07441 [Lamprigera yunnana]